MYSDGLFLSYRRAKVGYPLGFWRSYIRNSLSDSHIERTMPTCVCEEHAEREEPLDVIGVVGQKDGQLVRVMRRLHRLEIPITHTAKAKYNV